MSFPARIAAILLAAAPAAGPVGQAAAAPVYVALGDSITFGETDLSYRQSDGDRGYVSRFADTLAARNGGVRPIVANLAIDGETAASFLNNANPRTPPVMGRTNVPLQLENSNYRNSTALSQGALFANTVAAQQTLGNTVQAVTITLGFNELAALVPMTNAPATEQAAIAQIPATLAAYRANYSAVLDQVRSTAPGAAIYLLNYYDPFPGDPTGANPATPVFAAGGPLLNATIRDLAAQYGTFYVDTSTPFVGNERAYTFIDEQPAGFFRTGDFGGVEPIGNVHPNEQGYGVIAAQVASATTVPEPPALAVLLAGLGALGAVRRRRRRQGAAPPVVV